MYLSMARRWRQSHDRTLKSGVAFVAAQNIRRCFDYTQRVIRTLLLLGYSYSLSWPVIGWTAVDGKEPRNLGRDLVCCVGWCWCDSSAASDALSAMQRLCYWLLPSSTNRTVIQDRSTVIEAVAAGQFGISSNSIRCSDSRKEEIGTKTGHVKIKG